MMPEHYNLDELLAFLERGEGEKPISRHLSGCPECRERLRQLVELRRIAAGPADHPDSEDLSAFQAGALGPQALDSIRAHLGDCPACRDSVRVMELQEKQYPAPGPRLAERLSRLYRKQFAQRHGRLVIHWRQLLTASWEPEETGRVFSEDNLQARRRANGMERPAEEETGGVFFEEILQAPCPAYSLEGPADFSVFAPSEAIPPTHIQSPDFDIGYQVYQQAGDLFLVLTLFSRKTKKPAQGVTLRLRKQGTEFAAQQTDAGGAVEFRLPLEEAVLVIEGREPFEIPLEISKNF